MIFGRASDPLASTVLELLKPKVKQGGTLYSQPNVDLLSTDAFSSPDFNLSSDTGTSSTLSMPVSTLRTSDEDDQDPKVEGSLEPLGSSTVKLIENDEKRKRSPSLKRSHSEEAKSSQQSCQRQRKRCTEQIREVELQCEVAHTSALLNTPNGGSVASLAEKTTGHGKRLSLHRKGNFTQQNKSNGSIQRGGNVAAIQNG